MKQTISELLEFVDEMRPNPFSESAKTRWVNELETEIQTKILLVAPSGIVTYKWPDDRDTELLIEGPNAEIYENWLYWKIDVALQEADKANNDLQLYNSAWDELMLWTARHVHPRDGYAQIALYYLSAYQIAVKHGYTGTEEEWIATAHGTDGRDGFSPILTPVEEDDGIRVEIEDADGTKYFFIPYAEDGVDAPRITGISIDASYHLIVTLSNGQTYDAGYCRGASGSGTGDMLADDYDPDNTVHSAGGIVAYINSLDASEVEY